MSRISKIFLLLNFVIVAVYSSYSQSTIWVSNRNDISVDYSDLQEAIDDASNGDTIMVYPSPYGYGDISINKNVSVVGMGYDLNLSQQPSLEVNTETSGTVLANVTITSDASGGNLRSVELTDLLLECENFIVKNCHIKFIEIYNSTNIGVLANYIWGLKLVYNSPSNSSLDRNTSVILTGDNSNILFGNNLFSHTSEPFSRYYSIHAGTGNTTGVINQINGTENNIVLEYNVFTHKVSIAGAKYYNNITQTSIGGTDALFQNNITTFNGVFRGFPDQTSYSFDTRYQLSETSPAKGAATDGGDCGAYGGAEPYQPSGIYNRPLIYQLNMDRKVSGALDVNIKVRSN